jgi:hypothetical protein
VRLLRALVESGRTHDEGGSIFDAPECGSLWHAPFHAYDFINDLETMLQELEEEQKERMVVRVRVHIRVSGSVHPNLR